MADTQIQRTQSPGELKRITQLDDLLMKSEKRVDRLKVLNDQIKKQLEMEIQRNQDQHSELSELKSQLFKTQQENRQLKEEIDQERSRSEKLQLSLNRSQQLTPSSRQEGESFTSNNNLANRASIKSYTPSHSRHSRPLRKTPEDADVIALVQRHIADQLESENSGVDENQFEDTDPYLVDPIRNSLTKSVRLNREIQSDHIKLMSKSIVARNYESKFNEASSSFSSLHSPTTLKAAISPGIASSQSMKFKLVQSSEILDEIPESDAQQEGGIIDQENDGTKMQNISVFKFADDEIADTNIAVPYLAIINNEEDVQNQISFRRKASSNFTRTPVHKMTFCRKQSRTLTSIKSTFEKLDDQDLQQIELDRQIDQNTKQSTSSTPTVEGLSENSQGTLTKIENATLFENFFILGGEKEDMQEFDADPTCTQALLPGKILYAYPPLNQSPQDDILKVIYEFALPNQIISEKIPITSSFRRITDLILQNSKSVIQSRFFMFTMKSAYAFDREPSILKKSQQEISVIDAVNPHKLLYCFCFEATDYLETTTSESAFELENRRKRTFWESKKVYCFVTYFPFFELFQEMLINVRNQVKISRSLMYSEQGMSNQKLLQQLDGDCIKTIVQTNMQPWFDESRAIIVREFRQVIQIDTLGGWFTYIVGQRDIFNTQTHKWSLPLSLSNLSFSALMFIFHALLLENTLVFLSHNKCLLSHTIHTFEQLIFPFSWPHPIVYMLPDTLDTLLDSPVPIVLGVSKSAKEFLTEDLLQNHSDHIFIDLDSHRMYCANKNIPKEIIKDYSHLNNLTTKLQKLYEKINPQGLAQKKPQIFETLAAGEKQKVDLALNTTRLKYLSSKSDDQIAEIVLNLFNESIRQCFVDILTKLPEQFFNSNHNQIIDSSDFKLLEKKVCECGYKQDRPFLTKFTKTQIFLFFLENHLFE